MKTVGVTYTCGHCHVIDRVVKVVARNAVQDAGSWIERIMMPTIANDHRATSPLCKVEKLKLVKIPMPSDQSKIGYGE